jgi:hypothetical protein
MTNNRLSALARLRLRQQNVPLRFAFADRVDFLNAADWDAVTAHRGLLMTRSYLRMIERVRPANLDPRYALLYRDERPVAALAMQSVDLAAARLHKPTAKSGLRGWASRTLARATDGISARVLVIGNLLSYGSHGVAIAPGLVADDAIWHGIAEAAYRVRRAEKHAGNTDFVLVKDLDGAEIVQSARLHDLGFRPIETEPNMVLRIAPAWKTYEDYLGALNAKYRKNLRSRVLKPIEDAGLVVERVDAIETLAPRLHQTYLAVHENAALRPVTLTEDYWPALARCAGEAARFAVLRRGETVLGFVLTLREDAHTAIGYHIGFDRQASATLPLYLRLLQCTVEDAIALGARRLSLGRTALEPKAALGAKPEALHVWVRHRQPVMNRLIRALLGSIHHDTAPERNPFGLGAAAETDPG